ncbi:MAG: Type IV pilus assembly protein PilM [Candidatus Woesebacteria bacterium GW2011_GWA1_39_21]|uniref:Type IV pilus assembly protein PilM n=1 Tax=Candidatus Woesebacteria bacterium GW2011_GWA1_39_21 TaxID=1618550 RepID=A0A0G0QNP8_9BACT|nr:MAG: Type IV pilus assembly protein PilM [Candidatus Woesebacteria bacterium GW2011_GWA1_39_21]
MVGLDIGSKTIKIVELEETRGTYRLRASGIIGYKSSANDNLVDDKEVAVLSDIIRKLHKEAKIVGKDTVVSIPETQVYTRMIHFPLLTDSEIASAVKWEAEQYIPFPIDEAVIDYQVVDKNENATPPNVQVLLIAAPKVLVNRYIKLIQMSKLDLVAVETELMAISRSICPLDQTVIVADFGARSTNIAIVKNASLMMSRSIPTAGDAFTRAVAQGLGIESQQAEEYKKTYGLSSSNLDGKIKSILYPVLRMVSDEIKKAMHFYQSEAEGQAPRSLILTGGSSGMPEVASMMTELLGIEVSIGSPFSKIQMEADALKTLSGYAPFYAISVGLAMRT